MNLKTKVISRQHSYSVDTCYLSEKMFSKCFFPDSKNSYLARSREGSILERNSRAQNRPSRKVLEVICPFRIEHDHFWSAIDHFRPLFDHFNRTFDHIWPRFNLNSLSLPRFNDLKTRYMNRHWNLPVIFKLQNYTFLEMQQSIPTEMELVY